MAAVAAPRMPSFQSHDLPLIKKPFDPLATNLPGVAEAEESETMEVDDDDFSDHDSHYSEDLPENFDFRLGFAPRPPQPDVTQQLLVFAQNASNDIQRYFGRKRDDEESCDIYEDKWVTTKSGRELYYADLLRMAQGEGEGKSRRKGGGNSSPIDTDNRHQFSGRADKKLGLGPLEELFEVGLRRVQERQGAASRQRRSDDGMEGGGAGAGGGGPVTRHDDVVPMHERRLPESFWSEPRSESAGEGRGEGPIHGLLGSSKPPDFGDLLQNWTAADHQDFNSAIGGDGRGESLRHTDGGRV